MAFRREDGSFFFCQIDFVLDGGGGSVVLAILTVCVGLRSQYWCPRIYGFWIIASSIWFVSEYHFIFNRKDDDTARDQLKMAQEVAQKFWAASQTGSLRPNHVDDKPDMVNLYIPSQRQFIQLFVGRKIARVMTFPGAGPIPTHGPPA